MGSAHGATDSRRVVQASDILEKIERDEPVNYDGVIVEGNLDLSGRTLGTVHFNNTIFQGYANFKDVSFTRDVWFLGADFGSSANFAGAKFSEDAYFKGVKFIDYAYFEGAQFWGNANFMAAQFSGPTYFWMTQFNNEANFRWTQFTDYVGFSGAKFNGEYVDFIGVRFSGIGSDFKEVKFSGIANFGSAKFSGSTNFKWTQFSDYAYFGWAEFSDWAYFEGAQFNSYAHFGWANFKKGSSFINTTFENVTFEGAQFNSNAYFENTTINYSINLTKTSYISLLVPWESIDDHQLFVSDDDAYLALMRNYANLGWFEDSNNCYYEYRNKRWVSEPISFERLTDALEWLLYGYGVKPHYTLTWIAISILIFGLAFRNGGSIRKYIKEEREEDLTDETIKTVEIKTVLKKDKLSFIDPFLFSLTTFTSGFTSFLYPSVEYRAEKHKRLVILERLLGSVFLALLITAISKTYLIR